MFHFNEIYEEHQHLVFNLCLNYLQNHQDAEEATQDVFVKIHAKMGSFEGKSSLKTWVYRITVNHCLDVLRQRKRQSRLAFFTRLFVGKTETPLELPHFDHPGVLLENRETLENLFHKINQLPENQRTALILKYLDDLPQREIADIMQVSEKAVESLLQRAKQNLEKKLGDGEGK
jgi:RNA polymerase sigma-70 factor (ECF subfamily)